ncbi:MAG: glycosyltransferase 87 family protein [Pyrinomonadaceae bacterium]
MSKAVLVILRLVSTLVPLVFLFSIYTLLHKFDYFNPFVKLAAFAAVFMMIVIFQLLDHRRKASPCALWIEVAMLSVLLITVCVVHGGKYEAAAFNPPISDIGYTTIHAVNSLVNEHRNPYSRSDINYVQTDLDPGYRGFHYGPGMMAGYTATAFSPTMGYRLTNLVYLLITLILLILLIRKPDESLPERLSNILFVFTAYFLAERFWIEMLPEGANDIFHVMLILAALLALKKDRVFWSGLLTGFSCSAKFAPGMFLVPFMPLRQRNFWLGLALGLSPYLPFVFWDYAGLWRNAFWLRVIVQNDGTGLYWVTPKEFQWIYGAIALIAFVSAFMWAIRRELKYESVLVGFALLLIVVDITQRQVHGNHLIWFYPVFAILFMGYRERLFGLFSSRMEASV